MIKKKCTQNKTERYLSNHYKFMCNEPHILLRISQNSGHPITYKLDNIDLILI